MRIMSRVIPDSVNPMRNVVQWVRGAADLVRKIGRADASKRAGPGRTFDRRWGLCIFYGKKA